jgi:hypothetical protein
MDAHLLDRAVMLFQSFLPTKAADSVIMGWCHRAPIRCSKKQGQLSLTVCWRSFAGHHSDVVTIVFDFKGGWGIDYKLMSPHSHWILQDVRPKVVDTTLLQSFRIRQWVHPLSLLLPHWSIHSLWNDVTMQPFECWMCKTKNGCYTDDAHINHIETSIGQSLLVFEEWYIHHRHPTLHVQVFLFPSRSFVASPCLINPYPHYLREKWCSPLTFLCIQPTCYGI